MRVVEGNHGYAILPVRIRLSEIEPIPMTFGVETRSGTAKQYADFVPFEDNRFTIDTGDRYATLNLQVVADRSWEPNEHFKIVITPGPYAYATEPTGQAWIRNDDTRVTLDVVPLADQRVDVTVATRAPQPDVAVDILRGATVLYSGALDDAGKPEHRLDQRFKPGSTVRLRARVTTSNGPYRSNGPVVSRIPGDRTVGGDASGALERIAPRGIGPQWARLVIVVRRAASHGPVRSPASCSPATGCRRSTSAAITRRLSTCT